MEISRRTFTAMAAGTAAATVAGCQHNPAIDRSQFILIPDSWLEHMSHSTWTDIQRRVPVVRDGQLPRVLERVGTRLADASGRTDQNWEFALLANQVPNAFVLPGGKVAVHTGILPLMDNEEQLSAVIGHEVGHVVGRHASERVSQQLAASGALLLAQWYFWGEFDSTTRRLIFAALGAGVSYGILMPYSRQHEYEADTLGVQYMAKAGYDPNAAAGFWQNMMQASAGRARPMEFMSTHPADDKRLAEIREQIPGVIELYQQNRRA